MENIKDKPTHDTNLNYSAPLRIRDLPCGDGWERAAQRFLNIIGYEAPKGNKKARLPAKDQMKILLLNLQEAYQHDPTFYVSVKSGKASYRVNGDSENPLGVSYKIVELYGMLYKAGLIEVRKGYFDRTKSFGEGKCTRIRAKPELIVQLADALRDDHWVEHNKDRPKVVLREKKLVDGLTKTGRRRKKKKSFSVEFEEDAEISKLVMEITEYQDLLDAQDIRIKGWDEDYVSWPRDSEPEDKPDPDLNVVDIHKRNTFTSRVFNNGSFDIGGRFYGPWWQAIPDYLRADILINGEPTVEIDYSSHHVRILYAQLGETPPEDPYTVDKWIFPNIFDRDAQRKYAKLLLLTAINAPDRKKAYAGFRKKLMKKKKGKKDPLRTIKNHEIEFALDEILKLNHKIEHQICTGKGLELMNVDSHIAAMIINHLTIKNIPVLSIHDSFIVTELHKEELKFIMHKAMKDIVGIESSFK